MKRDSLINKIVYYIIAETSCELDNIEGRILDADSEEDVIKIRQAIYAAQAKAYLGERIGEMLQKEGYGELGSFVCESCDEAAQDGARAGMTLKEEIKNKKKE